MGADDELGGTEKEKGEKSREDKGRRNLQSYDGLSIGDLKIGAKGIDNSLTARKFHDFFIARAGLGEGE